LVIGFPVAPGSGDDGVADEPAAAVVPGALLCPKIADTILPNMLMASS
jgi:hypothetical protein